MNKIIEILLEVTVYSSVIAGILLLLRALFKKKISAKLQYMAWLLLIVRLMVPITVESGVHFFTIKEKPAVVETAAQETQAESKPVAEAPAQSTPQIAPSLSQNTAPQAKPQMNAAPAETVKKPTIHITWQQVVFGVWMMGLIAIGVFFIRARVRFMRRMKETMQMPTEEMQREYDRICEEMMLLSAPELWVCGVASPALMGRRILLPEGLSGQTLRYALYHELTHYRRKDHIMVVIMSALRCVYWFNPLVWVSFSAMQTDMEVACDAGVMERIGAEEKRGYLTTLLNMFSAHSVPAIGMAQAESKRAAKARIEGAFRKHRTGRGMRMVSAIAACMILVCCFTTACQPTPEKPIVVNKNDGKLEEKLEETVEEEQIVIEGEQDIVEEKSALRWTEEIETESGISLDIDADVIIPDATKFPVIRVKPRGFSDEEIQKAVAYLSDGAILYENTTNVTTKEWIEQFVLNSKKELSELQNSGDKNAAQMISSLKSQITYYELKYDSAPTAAELGRKEIALEELNSQSDIMFQNRQELYATFRIDDAREKYNKCVLRYSNFAFDGAYTDHHYQDSPARGMKMSRAEAKALADETLAGMEIKDFELSETLVGNKYLNINGVGDQNQQSYMFYYTRAFSGIMTQYIQLTAWKTNAIEEDLPDSYRPPWTSEYIMIEVDESGVVSIEWFNPVEIIEIENENVSVMSFDEVSEQFVKNMETLLSGDHAGISQLSALKVNIEKVVLAYQFLPIRNNYDEYRMIPCWIFMGNDNVFATSNFIKGPVSEISINAVDGSIL